MITNVPTTKKRNAIAKLKVLYNSYFKIGKKDAIQEEHRKRKGTEVKKHTKPGLVEQISDSEYEETGDEELLISKYDQQKTRKTIIIENHPIKTLTTQNKS